MLSKKEIKQFAITLNKHHATPEHISLDDILNSGELTLIDNGIETKDRSCWYRDHLFYCCNYHSINRELIRRKISDIDNIILHISKNPNIRTVPGVVKEHRAMCQILDNKIKALDQFEAKKILYKIRKRSARKYQLTPWAVESRYFMRELIAKYKTLNWKLKKRTVELKDNEYLALYTQITELYTDGIIRESKEELHRPFISNEKKSDNIYTDIELLTSAIYISAANNIQVNIISLDKDIGMLMYYLGTINDNERISKAVQSSDIRVYLIVKRNYATLSFESNGAKSKKKQSCALEFPYITESQDKIFFKKVM